MEALQKELDETRRQLDEALDTIEAIRTGQVDALVVQTGGDHQLYTLQSADRAYRVFIEKMAEGAVTLNHEGIILYANSQFSEMVACPLSAVTGLSFQRFVAKECSTDYNLLFKAAWAEDCKGELCISKADDLIPVQLSFTALELEEGISLSVIVTDLTQQKAAQKQLEQNNHQLEFLNKTLEASNHDLQQFASVASHDLQEPLRKIQMFSKLLQDKTAVKLNEEEKRYLDKLIHSASRMKTLIVDVLNYSKLSANNNHFVATDLNNVLDNLIEDYELMIQEKKAVITYENLGVLEVNPGQIRQVFQNLLSNALKFSMTNASVVIQITAKRLAEKNFDSIEQSNGPFCFLSVRDNGIGFDEKYTPNVFALFERLHAKDVYEGSGIGLSIAKKIVEKHNGLIRVKSTEGKGSDFQIILPFKQDKK